jgi:magnesium chelatase subunit D
MNPEEGELRPQLLDRFGLAVDVAAPRDPALRVEVVRRRMSYDADPAGFAARWAEQERVLADRVAAARLARTEVDLPDAVLLAVAQVCAALEVDGLRADLVTARTARAHAAWCGRHEVTDEDVRVAARLALPHRRRRSPFDSPDLDDDRLEQALDEALGVEQPDPEPDPEPDPVPGREPGPQSGDGPAGPSGGGDATGAPPPDQPADGPADGPVDGPAERASTVAAGDPFRARLLEAEGRDTGIAGRRSRASGTSAGRRVGARPGAAGGVHLLATVLAAVPHQHERGRSVGPLRLAGTDLRTAVREGREANLVLFCVDASGSMAARRRMQEVKTAILSLLLDAYQRRDTVGLVTFAGDTARLVLPPTASVDVAATRLAQMPAGGRTPLAEGLLEAAAVLERERRRPDARRPLLVVITDGRATSGRDAVRRSHEAAGRIAERGTAVVVVDCESGPLRMGLAAVLADRLRAEHLPLAAVDAAALRGVVRGRAA